ncbi:MAG: nitrilase-related carbon-nitrogen hydrolase, partial [Bacteroidia bacterium]
VHDGAEWLAVVTNDAWWGFTDGHRQHFDFSRLRAIEQRQWVARSANTGISGFIDPLGRVVQASEYNTRDALTQTLYAHPSNTLYNRLGDAFWLLLFLLAFITAALLPRQSK